MKVINRPQGCGRRTINLRMANGRGKPKVSNLPLEKNPGYLLTNRCNGRITKQVPEAVMVLRQDTPHLQDETTEVVSVRVGETQEVDNGRKEDVSDTIQVSLP